MKVTYPNAGAYPANNNETTDEGLTKREYFAAMAMQGLLSCDAKYGGKEDHIKLTRDSVRHADLLINALNR
jgi:acetolactate synthase regulatory subunit